MTNKESVCRFELNLTSLLTRMLFLCLIFSSLSGLASGQGLEDKRLSHLNIPRKLRTQLIERFDLFVAHEKTQCYEKQFDLLAQAHLADLLHMNVTKENYVKFKEETENVVGRLVELRVKKVEKILDSGESLRFSVRAKLQKPDFAYFDEPILVAYLIGDNWYFSLLYVS